MNHRSIHPSQQDSRHTQGPAIRGRSRQDAKAGLALKERSGSSDTGQMVNRRRRRWEGFKGGDKQTSTCPWSHEGAALAPRGWGAVRFGAGSTGNSQIENQSAYGKWALWFEQKRSRYESDDRRYTVARDSSRNLSDTREKRAAFACHICVGYAKGPRHFGAKEL